MGYRSEVALVLNKNGCQTLTAMLAEPRLPQETREAVDMLKSHADEHYFDPATGAEAYRWERVKWYEDDEANYPHIAFFQKLMERLPVSSLPAWLKKFKTVFPIPSFLPCAAFTRFAQFAPMLLVVQTFVALRILNCPKA